MGKTITLSESELINIVRKMVLDDTIISEVKKVEDFDEDYPDYVYSAIGVIPSKTSPNQIGVVFFNGPNFTLSDYREPEESRPVYFIGPMGDFQFDSRDIHFNGKSPYVFGNKLSNVYYDKLFPLMKSNNVTSLRSAALYPSLSILTGYEVIRSSFADQRRFDKVILTVITAKISAGSDNSHVVLISDLEVILSTTNVYIHGDFFFNEKAIDKCYLSTGACPR